MKLAFWVTLLLIFRFTPLLAQPTKPADYGLKHFTIEDKNLGLINFYVSQKDINEVKPLLVVLDGSGYIPLVTLVKLNHQERIYNSFDPELLTLFENYHVVLIGKPGIQFCDTVVTPLDSIDFETLVSRYLKPSETFQKRNSLYWRADAASGVIDFLFKNLPVDKKKVVVYGYSEGGQVAPYLALKNKKVTHCISVVGGGLNQFYDFILALRIQAAKREITPDEAQNGIDSLYKIFTDIYDHPANTKKQWEGNTYLRWASYSSNPPLNSLLKLNIPIFMAVCGKDTNSPIFGLDYVKLAFLQHGKDNLTYNVYPNYDHFFNEITEDDGQGVMKNHKLELLNDILQWLENNK